jgi:chaperonin GroEL
MYTENCNLRFDKDDIIEAIETIVTPIAKTMSPRGGDVLFRGADGEPIITNDGATISNNFKPKNELQALIIDTIVKASKQTEKEAGDATSTTILLIGKILMSFINSEMSHFDFISSLKDIEVYLLSELERIKIDGSKKEDLLKIAYISSNNDKDIAEMSVDVISKAGEFGTVNIDMNSQKPNIKFDGGFIKIGAIPSTEFLNKGTHLMYERSAIFITDGTLFYNEDINIIVQELAKQHKDIIIVANKFQGKTQDLLLNIQSSENGINVLPLQFDNTEEIKDIAAYIGCPIFSKTSGRINQNDVFSFIGSTDMVSGNMARVIINKDEEPETRSKRIDTLRSMYNESEDIEIKYRLSSMTSGVVTLAVGGNSVIERNQRKLRFDDAILATSKAKIHGYLPGGGTALHSIYLKSPSDYLGSLMYEICTANIKQIHENCNKEFTGQYDEYNGLDAATLETVNMLEAGIFDSYTAVEQSLINAISVSIGLISAMSNTIIINKFN